MWKAPYKVKDHAGSCRQEGPVFVLHARTCPESALLLNTLHDDSHRIHRNGSIGSVPEGYSRGRDGRTHPGPSTQDGWTWIK